MSMDMITRTPYCHKIRYGVTGAPALTADEMEGSHRPGIGLDPTLIELVYSPARDGKPATVSASVTGWWVEHGEVSQPQQSVATHFRNGPDGWPGWLAEEVRLHQPAPPAPAICEIPHATVDEEDACEQQRVGGDTEAHPPSSRWSVESLDPVAEEWLPGSRYPDRAVALERYHHVSSSRPTWSDGTPVQRRLVRETATHTVEPAP